MQTNVSAPAAVAVCDPPPPDGAGDAVQAWQTFLEALDALTARHAAARQRPYTRQSAAALAALAADLANTKLRPDQVACCGFAWPPVSGASGASVADLHALAADCARPTQMLP